MSPRRRIDPFSADPLNLPPRRPPHAARQRGLTAAVTLAAVVMSAALALSAVTFAHSRAEHRREIRDAAVLDFVRSFVTQYTSPDPFNANAYADRVLAQGTGEFAKFYTEKMNEIVVQVARAEPGAGTVQEIGIERWNDDGSANVVAVAAMTTTFPDGSKFATASRWLVTAIEEGQQWKVSNLIQVI